MIAQKRIKAGRRNSRGSSGPKTRTGKAESKMNAMKHGLLAADLVVRDEDPVEFTRVLDNLVDELQPQGPLEEQLVERVAACMWRLRRLYRVEAGIFTHESLEFEYERARIDVEIFEEIEDKLELRDLAEPPVLTTNEKRIDRALARAEKAVRLLREESLVLSVAFKENANYADAISKLTRYEAAIERSLYRALHELQRVPTGRPITSVYCCRCHRGRPRSSAW